MICIKFSSAGGYLKTTIIMYITFKMLLINNSLGVTRMVI